MRPVGLPEFENPPLNEVVMGVQFNPPAGYSQIRAGEVWNLYRSKYPLVEEHVPLQPQFETFGLPSGQSFNFGMVTGGQHDRFFFLTEDKQEIVQFQEDRLLHNWRQVEGMAPQPYPRFETLLSKFISETDTLDQYFNTLAEQKLTFTQVEISYINNITLEDEGVGSAHSDWLKFVSPSEGADPDDMACVLRRAVEGENGPFGRLIVDVRTGITPQQKRVIVLNITLRGNPTGGTLANVEEFLKLGRELIVHEFSEITTEHSHRIWGKV